MNTQLQPEEFDVVQNAFKRIAREPWFIKDIARQNAFARHCLHVYQAGMTDPDRLFEACERTAREQYSDPA